MYCFWFLMNVLISLWSADLSKVNSKRLFFLQTYEEASKKQSLMKIFSFRYGSRQARSEISSSQKNKRSLFSTNNVSVLFLASKHVECLLSRRDPFFFWRLFEDEHMLAPLFGSAAVSTWTNIRFLRSWGLENRFTTSQCSKIQTLLNLEKIDIV